MAQSQPNRCQNSIQRAFGVISISEQKTSHANHEGEDDTTSGFKEIGCPKKQDDLMNLDDDADAEEYLLSNGLISKQPGKVSLKGRGVCEKDLKRHQRDEEIKKKAEDRIDLVKAECLESIEAINLHYSTVIHKLVTKLKSCNLQPDFEDFNPFEGCPDNTYVLAREPNSDDEVSIHQFQTDQEEDC